MARHHISTHSGERRRQGLRRFVAALALAAACEPYEGVTKVTDLEREYRLTADEPIIALEVTACIQGDAPPDFEISGSFTVGARTDEGELAVVVENLGGRQRETIGAVSDIYEYATVDFVLQADWSGSGRRCSVPEVIEISVTGLAAGEAVTLLNPNGQVFVSGSDPGLCGDVLEHDEVSLNVERL